MAEDKKTSSTKTGRPKKRLDARTLRKVRAWLVEEEKPVSYVLDQLGLTVSAWAKLQTTDEALQDVIARMKLAEEERLVANLKASGQVVGSIFALKSRHQYVDKPAPAKDDDKRVNIIVHLPRPAASDAEYRKIVDAEFTEVKSLPAPGDVDDLV